MARETVKIFCAGCGENITALRVDHTLDKTIPSWHYLSDEEF